MEWQCNGIRIVDEKNLIDLDAVYNLLKRERQIPNLSRPSRDNAGI
jgi:hypothetical protein